MDPAALAGRLEAIETRLAGSDAERRAAALCAEALRGSGRRPRTTTLWIRPRRELARAFYAALGVAASITAVSAPEVGLGLAAGALVAALLEAFGIPVVSLLQSRRATQNVLAAPRGEQEGRVLLVLTASVDTPRESILRAVERSLPRFVPGSAGLLLGALLLVCACAGARIAGAEGSAIGLVQLLPSVMLILLLGLFLDAGLARSASRAPAAGAAVAVATAAALDAQPPHRLAVEVLLTGASHAGAGGMAAYVRARRKEIDAEDIVVLHLGSAGGPTRVVTHTGEHLPIRLHPRLVELALAVPGVHAARERGRTPARVARGARWPTIGLEGDPRPLAAATLRVVAAIDREVAQARSA